MALNYGYRVTRTRLLDSKLLEELKKRMYVIEIRMEIIFRILCIADVSRVERYFRIDRCFDDRSFASNRTNQNFERRENWKENKDETNI